MFGGQDYDLPKNRLLRLGLLHDAQIPQGFCHPFSFGRIDPIPPFTDRQDVGNFQGPQVRGRCRFEGQGINYLVRQIAGLIF